MASSKNHRRRDSKKGLQVITPPVKSGQCPNLWEMDEYVFQDMCCALLEQEEDMDTCSVYGTRGQSQFGIDLLAHNTTEGEHSVAQCKCYQEFSAAQIHDVSSEFFAHWEAKWSRENVTRFILMVACKLDLTQQQEAILREKDAFREKGITFELWSVSTICNKLRPHRGIVSQYIDLGWVERICGPAVSTESTHVEPDSLLNEVLGNQLQRSWSVIARDTTSQLDAMREAFRTGNIHKALDWIRQTKTDTERWPTLAPDVQAKVLRFEASLYLDLGNLETATALAADARSLVPNFDDSVLRTLLALHEHGPESALNELNEAPADVDSLNLMTLLLLENGRLEECCKVLDMHEEVLSGEPEALRLRGLMLRMKGDLIGASSCIDSAFSKKPEWVAVLFAKALVDFERALAPGVMQREFCPAFRIIDWPLVRRDDASLQLIRSAGATFDQLLQSSAHNPNQRHFLEGWKLTCLACDFERQDDAETYCRELITATWDHPVAVLWALGRGYARDALDITVANIESLLKSKKAGPEHIVSLVMCLAAQNNVKRALTVLRKTKGVFKNSGARTTWLIWMVQCLASNGETEQALGLVEQIPDVAKRNRIKGVVLRATISRAGGPEDAIQHLLACYEETGCGEHLFDACSIMAQHDLWSRVSEYVEALVTSVGTAESIRLCSIALFNDGEYRQVFDLIETHKDVFPSEKPTYDLRTIQVQCRIHLGQVNEAVADARVLYGQDPSTWNLCLYVDTLSRKGDFATLEGLARNIASDGSLPADTTLFLCDHIKSRNPELARELLKRTLQADLPDNLIALALHQAFGLGLDTEVAPLFARMPQLATEPQSGFQAFRIEDIAQMMKDEARKREEADAAYRKSDLPIQLLAEQFGPNLAVFYHTNLRLNQRNESTPPTILLARHGGMSVANDLAEEKPPWHLSIDLTALMLASHIGILESVAHAFAPLKISSRALPALKQMRDGLEHQQPARLEAQRTICRLADAGKIQAQEALPVSEDTKSQELIRHYPDEWVSLFEQMQAKNGFFVDFLPPTGRDVLGQRSALPDFCKPVVTNIRAIVDSLYHDGPLSQSEYSAALESMGSYGTEEAFSPIPSQGCPVHLHSGTAETLAKSGLLESLCYRFSVSIDRRDLEECIKEVNLRRPTLDETIQWLDELIDFTSRGIGSGTFETVPVFSDPNHIEHTISASACLLDIAAAHQGTVSGGMLNAIWCDDRSMQRATIKREYLVLSSCEILKGLLAAGAISQAEYYQNLLLLRSALVLFIPIEADEILHHLSQALVSNGELVETKELAILRRYAAACLCQDKVILPAAENPQCPADRGEMDILLNLASIPGKAMAEVWNMAPYDREKCMARAEWILANLYVSLIGVLNVSGVRKQFHVAEQFACLDAESTLTNSLWINEVAEGNNRPRREYLRWIYDRLLEKRFRADDGLLEQVVRHLLGDGGGSAGIFRSAAEMESEAGHADIEENTLEYQLALKAFKQRLFTDLPEPLKRGFSNHLTFLDEIGVVEQLHIQGKTYKASDFYRAAAFAVRGEQAQCPVDGRDTPDDFLPSGESTPQTPFFISRASHVHPVNDEAFWILHESEERRQRVLRQHREWFGCPDDVFESAVREICVLESPQERFEALIGWRASSATYFYGALQRQLEETQALDLRDLSPERPECILYHYVKRYPQKEPLQFLTDWDAAIATRAAEQDFEKAFFAAACLPVRLPENLISAFMSLEDEAKMLVLKSLNNRVHSPLSRFHLIHLVLANGDLPSHEYAQHQISYLLGNKGRDEMAALLALLGWVGDDLNFWPGIQEWSATDCLVVMWVQACELFRTLSAVGTPNEWIRDTFSNATCQISSTLFGRGAFRNDIANPKTLTYETFLLPALAYAIQPNNILSDEERTKVLGNAFQVAGADMTKPSWKASLLRDPAQYNNGLGAFLDADRGLLVASLGRNAVGGQSLSNELLSNVLSAVKELDECPESHLSWLQVVATLGDSPPYPEIQQDIDRILGKVSLSRVKEKSETEAATILLGIAFRALHSTDRRSLEHIKGEINSVAKHIVEGITLPYKSLSRQANFKKHCQSGRC